MTGDIGAAQIDLAAPLRTDGAEYADLIVGDGTPVTTDNQTSIVAMTLLNSETGEPIVGPSVTLFNATEAARTPGMEAIVPCVTQGSRVVYSLPTNDLGEEAAAQIGMGLDENVIVVTDFIYVALPKAEGAAVFNTQRGLPSVVRAADGRPGIIIPDDAAPTEVVTETIIEGEGEVVGDGLPMFHATAVGWNDRSVLTTTWDEPTATDPGILPAEVQTALQQAKVGSQLLVVVPDPGNQSAQAWVVDVLGIIPQELSN